MEKQETIAGTMASLMASGPAVAEYPSYKSLNDAVGKVHGHPAGKVQALAGEKAWAWTPDTITGVWRKATEEEINARRDKAASKNHGGPRSKVLSEEDRTALDAQVEALTAVNNPALLPLLNGLKAKQADDDSARKGSLKDRLAACVDKLGLEACVNCLEAAAAAENA